MNENNSRIQLTKSPPPPLFLERGMMDGQRLEVSSKNEIHDNFKEPQSGEIFIEECTLQNLAPLFEKPPFRNMSKKNL